MSDEIHATVQEESGNTGNISGIEVRTFHNTCWNAEGHPFSMRRWKFDTVGAPGTKCPICGNIHNLTYSLRSREERRV